MNTNQNIDKHNIKDGDTVKTLKEKKQLKMVAVIKTYIHIKSYVQTQQTVKQEKNLQFIKLYMERSR